VRRWLRCDVNFPQAWAGGVACAKEDGYAMGVTNFKFVNIAGNAFHDVTKHLVLNEYCPTQENNMNA
jgi:hypothetical protein